MAIADICLIRKNAVVFKTYETDGNNLYIYENGKCESIGIKADLFTAYDGRVVCQDVYLFWVLFHLLFLLSLVEMQVERKLMLENLKTCILLLPDESQKIIYLRFYENLTEAQIGEIYGITQQAVSRRLG